MSITIVEAFTGKAFTGRQCIQMETLEKETRERVAEVYRIGILENGTLSLGSARNSRSLDPATWEHIVDIATREVIEYYRFRSEELGEEKVLRGSEIVERLEGAERMRFTIRVGRIVNYTKDVILYASSREEAEEVILKLRTTVFRKK